MKTLLQTINEKLKIRKGFNKTKHNDISDFIHNIVEVLYKGLDLNSTDLDYYGPKSPKNYLYCNDLPYEQFEEFIDIIKDNNDIIKRQINFLRANSVYGIGLFRYDFLFYENYFL